MEKGDDLDTRIKRNFEVINVLVFLVHYNTSKTLVKLSQIFNSSIDIFLSFSILMYYQNFT